MQCSEMGTAKRSPFVGTDGFRKNTYLVSGAMSGLSSISVVVHFTWNFRYCLLTTKVFPDFTLLRQVTGQCLVFPYAHGGRIDFFGEKFDLH